MKNWKKCLAITLCILLSVGMMAGCVTVPVTTQTKSYIALEQVDKKLAIVCEESLILTEYDYSWDIPFTVSLDGTSAACLTEDGVLLYICDGAVKKIADFATSYRLSVHGDTLAYMIEQEDADFNVQCQLYLYHTSTGETEAVYENQTGYIPGYTLSPDGKTLAYLLSPSIWEMPGTKLLLRSNGVETERTELKEDVGYDLISVNDSTDIIYLLTTGIEVVSINGEGKKTKVGQADWSPSESLMPDGYIFYSNTDHSQLLFASWDTTYLSTQGQKAVQLGYGNMHPVERAFSVFHYGGDTVTCNFDDLNGQLTHNLGGGYFWYPNENGEYVEIAWYDVHNSEKCWLDPTGSYCYYMDSSQTLYLLDLKNGGQSTLLVKKVADFAVSNDCSRVYYFFGGLNYCSGTVVSEPVEINNECTSYSLCFSENGQLFYKGFGESGIHLYTVSKNGDVKLLLQNLGHFKQEDCGMIFLSSAEDYYFIRNGELVKLQVKTMG
jgi:hypothetical protein